MGEAVGHDMALAALLQGIVADAGSSTQRLLDIARFQHAQHLFGIVAPDAGKAVGLQFEPHGQGIGLAFRQAGLSLLDRTEHPHQVLHVVADLMTDDVGPCEVAAGAQPALELVEETQVEVDAAVRGQ